MVDKVLDKEAYLSTHIKLKCKNPKCQYEWNYGGKSKFWATCPRCLYKVKVKRKEEENE